MDIFFEIFSNPYSQIIIGFSIIITLIVPFKKSLSNLRKARESIFWPTTEGTILISRIVEFRNDEGTTMYKIELKYSYPVNGKTYTASGRFLDEEHSKSWIGKLQDFVDENRPNQTIKVFYYSENPDNSIIINDIRPRYYLTFMAMVIFILAGLFFIIKGINDL